MFSLRKSTLAWTGIIDGRPEVMFGVGDLNILAGIGAPWLLGTDAVEQHYRQFLRHSVSWRDQLLERYPILRNFVDDRNTVSIRWLRWLGFKLHDPVVIGGHVFRILHPGLAMCDIMMALTVASTPSGAAVQQGQASAAASRYNAQIMDMNAQLADRRAKDAIERGETAEQLSVRPRRRRGQSPWLRKRS
ncbi:phage protein Gp13 family protein [Bradyrhizobium cenepequi]